MIRLSRRRYRPKKKPRQGQCQGCNKMMRIKDNGQPHKDETGNYCPGSFEQAL